MVGVLSAVSHPGHSHWNVAADVGWQMLIGVVIGGLGAVLTSRVLTRLVRPVGALDPITALAAAGVIYGVAAVLDGSGFLAVFVAGLLLGDTTVDEDGSVRAFHSQLASVAELVVFVGLGLTVSLGSLDLGTVLTDGLVLAAILILVARPAAVAALLWPASLRRGEKVFIGWLGLRGAVPILLAAFAVDQHVQQAHTVYGIVFIVVTVSVLIQGSLIRAVAERVGVDLGPTADHA